MQHTLQVRAFFFNAKTDYLPYYKNFKMKLDAEAKASDILKEIKTANENFAYPEEKLAFRINNLVVTGEESIGKIVEKCGNTLQIDPVTSYRSDHCLIINDSDFNAHFEKILAPYATEEDKAYYESLYPLHYASESSIFNRDYCGDAILLTAFRMIENDTEHKDAILQAIDNEDALWSCEYEDNMFEPAPYDVDIESLKKLVRAQPTSGLCEKIMQKCMQKRNKPQEVDSLEGANVAYFLGDAKDAPSKQELFAQIEAAGGKVVRFDRESKRAGATLLDANNTIAYKKAATTLLDALDSGADVLVCADEAALALFTEHKGMLQKEIGREIPLAVISLERFNTLAQTKAEVA